jgi:hypothetical protein
LASRRRRSFVGASGGGADRLVCHDLDEGSSIGSGALATRSPAEQGQQHGANPGRLTPLAEGACFGGVLAGELVEQQQGAGTDERREPIERAAGGLVQIGAEMGQADPADLAGEVGGERRLEEPIHDSHAVQGRHGSGERPGREVLVVVG